MGRAERLFDAYCERIRPACAGIDKETGHAIASALLSYKFGLYGNAVEKAEAAIRLIEKKGAPKAIYTALGLLKRRAADLKAAVIVSEGLTLFSPEDREYLAMDLSEDLIEDRISFSIDNALILLYAVGLITSPDDEQALDEHRGFPIQIITSYRKQLDL
ncbi:hypothetical protein [Methanofollis fontis]|uniref:Uncharacterized protein n=1 Tax=Methanofollis fontis TaxID=2052832 RepID=A0A483CMP6_9EURY|nr:hypothetical protein [Methanofollis fontis]TAJ44239.1 hypothetical protein CUJ86_09475 [Methanofollis fontis]